MNKRQKLQYERWQDARKKTKNPAAFNLYDLYYRLITLADDMELSTVTTSERLMKDTLRNAAAICHDQYMLIEYGKKAA